MRDEKHLGYFILILHLHFCFSLEGELLEEKDSVWLTLSSTSEGMHSKNQPLNILSHRGAPALFDFLSLGPGIVPRTLARTHYVLIEWLNKQRNKTPRSWAKTNNNNNNNKTKPKTNPYCIGNA